ALLERVPPDAPAEYVHAQYLAGVRLVSAGQASAAEKHFRRVLDLDPQHAKANEKLAVLLNTEGRTWEALPFVQALIRSGQCGRDELLMVGGIDSMMIDNPAFIEKCRQTVPDDPIVLLGRGRLALLRRDDAAQAEAIFRKIVQRDPEQIEALARLGEILLEAPDPALFLRWNASLPKIAEAHPRTWYARGMWAKRNGQPRAAVRCFLEALRLHPNHASSNFQLSQVFISLGEPEAAEPFVERARLLSKLDFTLSQLQNLPDLELMRQVAEINEQLGCWWEAMGWCQAAVLLDPDTEWARAGLRRFRLATLATGEFTIASAQPALAIDLAAYPLPEWPEPGEGVRGPASRGPVDGNVRLVDVAGEAGLSFQYFNGTTPTYGPDHILTAPGGGVGVIDYDADGWPDLYFSQAGLWDQRGPQNPHRDRLFRNLGNGRFADVTESARLGDGEFGAGVAVGDYNGDGFPDLYVANVGPNRLYENLGDGTFREIAAPAGVVGEKDQWSTSAAIVDLDGDGLPEIYCVHYVLLKEALAKDCGKGNQPMGCAPTLFHADQDRLYQNLGDGRFRDVTDACGIRVPDGKGLGIVAADFDGSGRIHVYVGNDTTPNFFFVNATEGPGKPLKLIEKGLEAGLALNENGQCMASMGIAAGDADGDGLLDVYIGTFYHDSNTLLRQNPDHTFTDESRRANLREPTFNMLTFGTQFVDGELDGWLDIIQANGHVDPSYDPDVPDRMSPQYLKNLGQGKFVELTGRSLGPYFQKKCLGRAVAVLDWDRDGKQDVAISHLDVPAGWVRFANSAAG
ncbi:MAG: FG-GAP-like repeat-containing protein, partial [Thermoguttaceae bacterium]|nr:FG-GAP-like repeat-containing protein [Thermoguttaceae bacterium]